MPARTSAERVADARRRLENDANVWLATAGADVPHLIPLSLAWHDDRILVATPTDSPTVRNAAAADRVRAALDSADDVVIIDASAEVVDFAAADAAAVDAYVHRVGWNPADEGGAWSLLILTPVTARAWNGIGEIDGRTIMRNGAWVA